MFADLILLVDSATAEMVCGGIQMRSAKKCRANGDDFLSAQYLESQAWWFNLSPKMETYQTCFQEFEESREHELPPVLYNR